VDLGQSGARFKIGNAITSLGIAKNASETVVETLERIFNEIPSQNFECVFLSLIGLDCICEEMLLSIRGISAISLSIISPRVVMSIRSLLN
jgi:hypothetical protein